ncbi:MAG: hypothetical protein KKH61_19990 [Gammaproteobacteria bacterium]|nr:hypothetical protein [Gammaproteobacteria bacterium]
MSKPIWHLAISDLHAGSNFALIPPDTLARPKRITPEMSDFQRKMYGTQNAARLVAAQFYNDVMELLKVMPKCSYAWIGGDCVEGNRGHDGGLVDANTKSQEMMAVELLVEILKAAGHPKVYGCRGTPYHVTADGGGESDDSVYAQLPNMQAWEDTLFAEACGLTWRLSHFIARSSVAHGKQTPLAKEIVKNTLSVAMDTEPDVDILLFGHVHYCVSAGYPMSRKRAYTLPTLKMRGEAYGRRFNDFYDVGMMLFKQEKEGAPLQEYPLKVRTASRKPKVYRA